MGEAVVLRAARPSVLRLIVPGLSVVFMAALSVAAISVVLGGNPSVSAILLAVVIIGVTLWLCWDVAKSLGVVPLARVDAGATGIMITPPLMAWRTRHHAMTAGEPVAVAVMRQSSFLGATHVYRFTQGTAHVSLVSPSPVREADLDALAAAFAEVGTSLTVTLNDLGRGRGAHRDRPTPDQP
ncbi:hypothetical protein RN607_08875 [Demequina capsici]|uniref:Uncharacterized protein n=1 Tax=Demequina capsici TaxID=3075620 RepID=A0AA96F9L1_9MICO|nr:hypothetical protein [Demequina sp. PMTSA13]WNM26313.1 hypothetical protein RN607_08875 [Demequina sp. PMTSA13]